MNVVSAALARIPGVEGGIWHADKGSLAYAYPTYEGTGPKTDLPAAELSAIAQINQQALRADGPARVSTSGRAQTVVLHACPLPGPVAQLTAWTMLRVYSWSGPSYRQCNRGCTRGRDRILLWANRRVLRDVGRCHREPYFGSPDPRE